MTEKTRQFDAIELDDLEFVIGQTLKSAEFIVGTDMLQLNFANGNQLLIWRDDERQRLELEVI